MCSPTSRPPSTTDDRATSTRPHGMAFAAVSGASGASGRRMFWGRQEVRRWWHRRVPESSATPRPTPSWNHQRSDRRLTGLESPVPASDGTREVPNRRSNDRSCVSRNAGCSRGPTPVPVSARNQERSNGPLNGSDRGFPRRWERRTPPNDGGMVVPASVGTLEAPSVTGPAARPVRRGAGSTQAVVAAPCNYQAPDVDSYLVADRPVGRFLQPGRRVVHGLCRYRAWR